MAASLRPNSRFNSNVPCQLCHPCAQSFGRIRLRAYGYKRDASLPEWHGWHACRRGLGSNLYRLGVPDIVIQRTLRHANVSTTTGYYIKSASDDVRDAMTRLENSTPEPELDTNWTPDPASVEPI